MRKDDGWGSNGSWGVEKGGDWDEAGPDFVEDVGISDLKNKIHFWDE